MATDPGAVVERFLEAYNAQDFDAMQGLLAPDLHFVHYNRAFEFNSSAELIATLKAFAGDYVPDRVLGPALRTAVVGDTVYREQMWTGTLATDLPGFGDAGDAIADRLCSVFTVGEAGTIVEYLDYG
jgi:hypothetical protein